MDLHNDRLLAALSARVEALEAARADAERKLEIVRASERGWTAGPVLRDRLMFSSPTGDVASLPIGLARTIAAGRAADVDAQCEGGVVVFRASSDQVVAELPVSLFSILGAVLARWTQPPQASCGQVSASMSPLETSQRATVRAASMAPRAPLHSPPAKAAESPGSLARVSRRSHTGTR